MKNIEYSQGKKELRPYIKKLWEKQRKHHENISIHFKNVFKQMTFETRMEQFFSKAKDDLYNIITASIENEVIAYCIVTIDKKNCGTIESLFVEELFRKNKIGESLMEIALNWLDSNNTDSNSLIVATGNEQVLQFYEKFNFQPISLNLKQK